MLRTGRSLWARLWLIASCAALVLSLPACKSEEKANAKGRAAASAAKPAGIPIALKLTAAEKKKAAALVKRVKRGRFPKNLVRQRANTKLFIYLAATETKRDVILASLRAMRDSHRTSKSRRKPQPAGDDYALVTSTYLDSENAQIQDAAILASYPILQRRKPYQPAVDALVSIVESHPNSGARIGALKALSKVRNYHKKDAILGAVVRAMDQDSPTLVVYALQLVTRYAAKGLQRKNDFKARADRLLSHKNDVVRGRAAILRVRLSPDPALIDRVVPLLSSKLPFARSAGLIALGDLGDARAVHVIVPLVGDATVEMHRLSYRTLSGRRSTVTAGSRRKTVHDRALATLKRLSAKMDSKFEPPAPDGKKPEESRKAAVAAAKAWYAKVKRKLPKYEPPPAPEPSTPQSEKAAKKPEPRKAPAAPAAPPAQPQP